ncbi:MAG: hypothetical protein HC883_00790 [Bdellovibrionaceae bacterium]|nr:hypothetical protein [Pseudobdellovibrionaceae bacterium]
MGLYQEAPNPVWQNDISDTAYSQGPRPSLCVTYKPTWQEVPDNENLCNRPNLRIPPLPEVKVIAGFLGINHGIAALSRQLRLQFDIQCQRLGAYNWWFAMSILHAFRLDQRNRKQVITGIAKTLSGGQNGDFTDLDGSSVLAGARQTFLKNLTFANRQSFEQGGGEFTLMNSLQGIDPREWLPEIPITPTLIYTDVDNAPGCNASPQPISNLPQRPGAVQVLNQPFPQGLQASNLFPWKDVNILADSDFQFSIGFEKNPWYMPYVGVKVKTTPRQIFFPFGSGIEMFARSFAKPFGGRIGPWYQSRWERGAKTSEGDLVDPLMAPRVSATNSPDDQRRLPNYSRYPGDPLGLISKLGINSLVGLASLGIAFDSYKNIKEDISTGSPNDILAWDGQSGSGPDVRNFEIAALAPDLFDIAYYSIEPNFSKNYFPRLQANKSQLGIAFDTAVRTDLGHNGTTVPTYSVQEQMALAKQRGLQRSEAYYFVRDKAHLLTSWLPGEGAFNYTVADAMRNFGKCQVPDDNLKFNNPGSCVAGGGRTGYSVKLVNRDALLSTQHKIGGTAAPNAILNPPVTNDGW